MAETVTQQHEPERFEIAVEEGVAGFAQHVDHDGRRVFFHTEVDDAYAGRGLAGTLVRTALDATRGAGLRVVPVCSYVARFAERHHDWDDLLEEPTRDDLAAIPRPPQD